MSGLPDRVLAGSPSDARPRRGRARPAPARAAGRCRRSATPARARCSRATGRRSAAKSASTASRSSTPARCAVQRRPQLGEVGQHPTGRDRQVLAHGRRLGEQRADLAGDARPSSRRARRAASRWRPSSAAAAPDRRAARPACDAPTRRRRAAAKPGSCSTRDATTRAVRAIASARSAERFVQYSASAARVGTERPKSTCGRRGPTIGASVRPSTHTSLAMHAVGKRGSSPGASTARCRRAARTRSTPSSTANIRTTTAASPSGPPGAGRRRHVRQRRRPRSVERGSACRIGPQRVRSPRRRTARRPRASTTPAPCALASATPPDRTACSRPGHAERPVGGDLERVDRRVLEPPVQHVDRLEPVERAQPHPPLAHHQIGALDEVHAELHGEVRVVDVRRMVEPAREQHDARAVGRRRRRQRAPHRAGVAGDRSDLVPRHHVGHDARHHRPVEQRVADPGRRVGEVLDHAPHAVGAERDVDGVRGEPPPRRRRRRR